MNRLTKFDKHGYVCNINCDEFDANDCSYCPHFNDIINKLGEYEDSGLDSNTVKKVAEFMKLFPQLSEKYLKGE